jgi:DNA-binding Lrp family transcriptional regulator
MPIAFVFINTEPASMPEVLKKIKAVEGVKEAEMVYGVYDIVAKVKTETMDQLKQIISFKIRMLANVLTTNTLLVVLQE